VASSSRDRVVLTGTLPVVCDAEGRTRFLCATDARIATFDREPHPGGSAIRMDRALSRPPQAAGRIYASPVDVRSGASVVTPLLVTR
jgi:hypothetical protein